MPDGFSRTMRSLEEDRFGLSMAGIVVALLLLGGWAAWFTIAEVDRYEVTDRARIEVDAAMHVLQATVSGRVVASHLTLDRAVTRGEVLLEIETDDQRLQADEQKARYAGLSAQSQQLAAQIAAEEQAGRIASQVAEAALGQARAQHEEADALAKLAASEAERLRQLRAAGVLAERDLDRARAEAQSRRAGAQAQQLAVGRLDREYQKNESDRATRIQSLRADIAEVEAERATIARTLERLRFEAGRRSIRAPVSGRLGEVATIREGAFVHEGDKLGSIIPSGQLRIVAEFLPDTALGRIRPGQPATLRLEGFPWAQYGVVPARVESVGSEIRDGRVRVELAVDRAHAPPVSLQHGMPGTVEVRVERLTPAMLTLRAAGRMLAGAGAPQ